MKILHLLSSRQYSGAENVACQIISTLSQSNPDYRFFYCSPEGPISKSLFEKNISYLPLKKINIRHLRNIIDEIKPDIIHSHDMKASFFASIVCGNTPLVCHIHNSNYNSRRFSLKSFLFFLAQKKAFKVIWVSDGSFKRYAFSSKLSNKSVVLNNVIDRTELIHKVQLDKNEYDFDIVFLGRLAYPKNPQRFISIINKIKESIPKIKVAIVGTGELDFITKKMSFDLGLNNNICFFGFVKNPYKILASSKMMLMTSRWEGLPMSVLESLALGVPVISTCVEGTSEVIDSGIDGYLSDIDEELVEKSLLLIKDEALRKRMAKAAIDKFDSINDFDAYSKIINQVYLSSLQNK
ncbi:MAG: glycosyltransferase [Bacilli bacterium]|nr:glycosyltransferase [Bacilli bacterium]